MVGTLAGRNESIVAATNAATIVVEGNQQEGIVVEQGDGGGATLLTARIYTHSSAKARKDLQNVRNPGVTCQRHKTVLGQARKAGESADESDAFIHAQSVVSNSRSLKTNENVSEGPKTAARG